MIKLSKICKYMIRWDILFKPSAKQRSFIRTENQGSASYTDQSKHCSVKKIMKTSTTISIIFLAIFLSGCANPGIVKLSPDTYMLSRADRAGIFGNTAKLKASVIKDANEFAASMGKVAIPLSTNETPVYPGHFATFEYQFRVVDKDDSEAKRTHLVPRPNVVIEKNVKIDADIKTEERKSDSLDIYTELTKLDDLRKRGIITDAEFEAEKAKILNRSK